MYLLRNGKHHSKHMQNSWNMYGEECFSFEILEECDKNNVILREQFWIDELSPWDKSIGLNNMCSAQKPGAFSHTEETIQKLKERCRERDSGYYERIAQKQRGRPAHNKGKPGKPWTEEMRRLASIKRKGSVPHNFGKPHKEETKEKIRISMLAQKRGTKLSDKKKIVSLRESGAKYSKISELTGIPLSTCFKIYKKCISNGGFR